MTDRMSVVCQVWDVWRPEDFEEDGAVAADEAADGGRLAGRRRTRARKRGGRGVADRNCNKR